MPYRDQATVDGWVREFLESNADAHTEVSVLDKDFTFTPHLTYFLQVKVANKKGTLVATPLEGGGSGDLANLKEVDGFLELPADKYEFKEGEAFPFIPFR